MRVWREFYCVISAVIETAIRRITDRDAYALAHEFSKPPYGG